MLRLKEDHHLSPDDVVAVRLRVQPGALNMCNIQEPHTALEGKFSLRFTTALALGHGDTSEAAFTDARVSDPALTAIRDRVTVIGDGTVAGGTEVIVSLADGHELHEQVNVNEPATDLERQWQRLAAKFRGLASPVIGADRSEELISAVASIESAQDIRSLMQLCTPAGAGARR
jgi:2-methylcitrate dehydratase PrpD